MEVNLCRLSGKFRRGNGGPKAAIAGVWGAPAPQHEDEAPYFINSGGLLTGGGDDQFTNI